MRSPRTRSTNDWSPNVAGLGSSNTGKVCPLMSMSSQKRRFLRPALRVMLGCLCLAACLGQNCGVPTPGSQDDQVAGFHPQNPTTQPSGNNPIVPAGTTLNADAGADLVVDESTSVILDGSASAGTSTTVYSWVQIFGPPVTWQMLSDSKVEFTAPEVSGGHRTRIHLDSDRRGDVQIRLRDGSCQE